MTVPRSLSRGNGATIISVLRRSSVDDDARTDRRRVEHPLGACHVAQVHAAVAASRRTAPTPLGELVAEVDGVAADEEQ